jgi:hypothetical protein
VKIKKSKLLNIFNVLVVMFITLFLIKQIFILNDHILIKGRLFQTGLSNIILNDSLQYLIKKFNLTNIDKALLFTVFISLSLVWLFLILNLVFGSIFNLLL